MTSPDTATPEPCRRCGGTGTVYVTTYGGHDVDCGLCRGTGRAAIERGRRIAEAAMDHAEAAFRHTTDQSRKA